MAQQRRTARQTGAQTRTRPGGTQSQARASRTDPESTAATRARPTQAEEPSGRTRARRTQASVVADAGAAGQGGGRVKSGSVEAKSSLRSKFMGVMAGLTGVTMIAMGVFLAITSSSFVKGVSIHKGIEIAKATAALVRVQLDSIGGSVEGGREQRDAVLGQLRQYMEAASAWKQGDGYVTEYSDILSVFFEGNGDFSGFAIKGEIQTQGGGKGTAYPSVYIPRSGIVGLGDDIEVYELSRDYGERGVIDVFRFRVKLPGSEGKGFVGNQIVVDVDAEAIAKVNFNMYLIIGIAVLIAMTGVVFVAYRFSSKITKPVDYLVRDMANGFAW